MGEVGRPGRKIFCGMLVRVPTIVCALSRTAEAHEKWFVDAGAYPLQAKEVLADRPHPEGSRVAPLRQLQYALDRGYAFRLVSDLRYKNS